MEARWWSASDILQLENAVLLSDSSITLTADLVGWHANSRGAFAHLDEQENNVAAVSNSLKIDAAQTTCYFLWSKVEHLKEFI